MFNFSASRTASASVQPVGVRRHLAQLLLIAAACAATGQARAEEEGSALRDNAVAGQVADVGSTGLGLALGAAEANPLGILTLGVKAIAYKQIKEAPATEQPAMWSAYGAFGWGATANNLCVIAAIATGGAAAALCPLIGVVAGVTVYNGDEDKRNRETFAAICQEQRRAKPDLVCEYRDGKG
ncbi:hypothetical protein [Hydrogenophaga sp. RWCD_12]|uniref:hypothetical protein n=1 Tax=Hydrogenophaga sp. RWCD_12 TaxID=3391190 RepID=UPI0039855583